MFKNAVLRCKPKTNTVKKAVVILMHVIYWILYLFICSVMYGAIGQILFIKVIINAYKLPGMVAAIIPMLIGFYTFYFFIFDKYLSKKKLLVSAVLAVSFSIIGAIIAELVLNSFYATDKSFNTILFSGLAMALIALVNGTLGLVMKGFITWYGDIKLKVELNKKNYEMELALMKAQINPHFLFNTINNIDILIQKDAIKASEYLNKLSDIMRFMLYETKTEKIALEKEVAYIEKYVELQKIRTTNPNYVKYEVKGSTGNLLIEPMLFIPFIENAFKHAENKKVENAIKICFVIEKDKIKFECENAYSADTQLKPEHSGLGNDLIQRRLVLLYPDKHAFEVINKNGIYKVNLLLSL